MLVDRPMRDLLAAFASPDPTPGGGSASALAAAVGASLLAMVASLPKTRHGSEADRAALAASSPALDAVRRALAAAIDADSAAYDHVVAAYRLPKATADEQAARKAAVQRALQEATDVPLGVMRHTVDALEQASIVAAHGHVPAASDIGVALALLAAASAGAKLNVDANLAGVTDAGYRERTAAEAQTLRETTNRLAAAAEALLR